MVNRNFIKHVVDKFVNEKRGRKKAEIYHNMDGMTRQNFYSLLEPERVVSPNKWSLFRKALGKSRSSFWGEAMEFHDKEE